MKVVPSTVAAVLATALALGGVCVPVAFCSSATGGHGRNAGSSVPANGVVAQLSDTLHQLAAQVSPAVVQIEVSGLGLTEDRHGRSAALIERRHSIGAGIIVDAGGYIMTNAHVVEGAQRVRVMLSPAVAAAPGSSLAARGRRLDARVVGVEELADLALLKVEADDLPTVRLNLDRSPQPGELVVAIGSPNGLQNTVTLGVISAGSRQPDPDHPMVYLQTDAAINQGNSGGPLVDVSGAVVGLNTFILSRGGGSEGLGFAIPARIVDFVYQSLRQHGRVDRVEIGVVPQVITPTMAEGLGLAQDWGVVMADVFPGGPAEAAGLKVGDIVVEIDGSPVVSLMEFAAALYQHPRDELLEMAALRGDGRVSLEVSCLPARDLTDVLGAARDPARSRVAALGILGLDVNDKVRSAMPDLRVGAGVLVIGHARSFDSVETGLLTGDVIHAVNRMPVDSVEQLRSRVGRLQPGDSAVLTIERMGLFQYMAFEMD